MAVIKKTLFPKNLEKFAVLVNDTQLDSKYFKITELPDTFTGGKNAFLIAGSEYLVPDTKIQIELKDSAGNVIYHEPGQGLISSSIGGTTFMTEYFEGVSKVVAVYVYPETAYGPCTLTILGELGEYEDGNSILTPVPLEWENKYNIKWQRTLEVNPALPNTTKIRFYRRPTAIINEILSPIYRIESGSKVNSGISQSFADVKISNLETFAGDVKRVKVFRTSEGDISDYDLIQDILIEARELLTTFGVSGSVVANTGIFTDEVFQNYWKTGSLVTSLSNDRVENGLKLNGSGLLTYSSSLDINSLNTYELNLDAFYSSSTSSNLGIYLSYVSQSTTFTSSIATLVGTQPTKNLLDTVIPFRIDKDYPSASLYFSQSQGEWHLGNISLKLSEDTAFSPDEVSFISAMPTVISNQTFNFKFEFYDVNSNYVPVEVTQSAIFDGGNNNIGGTLLALSSSTSSSLADLNRVSSSISGTMTVYSSSASSSIGALSSSVSSSNVFILSSSLSKVQQLANGQFSGSFIGDTFIYSPTIGGQQGYISDLFKVGTAPSIYLDARQNPRKIFIGGNIPSGQTEYSGAYNNANTNVYLDSSGKFSLGNQLSFSGNALTVNGTINVTGGNAATDANALLYSQRAVTSGSNAASTAYNNATAQLQLLADGGYSGSFIGSTTIYSPNIGGQNGYISNILRVGQNGITLDGGNKKIYVGTGTYNNANTPFYFASGSTNVFSLGDKLTFNGNTLSVNGSITTNDANIGGWNVNGTSIFKGAISLKSNTPEIRVADATNGDAVLGTVFVNNLTSGYAGSSYVGAGGMQVNGSWSTAYNSTIYPTGYPRSYIRMAAGASSAQFQAINTIPNYNANFCYFEAFPTNGTGATVRIQNGGLYVANKAITNAESYSDEVVNYNGSGNSGYGIVCVGAATFSGDVTANTSSDKRLKDNIVPIKNSIDKILKISGNTFQWKDGFDNIHLHTGKSIGVIAQEIEEVLPEIVTTRDNGYKAVDYEKIVALLIEGIKELKLEIEELKKNK